MNEMTRGFKRKTIRQTIKRKLDSWCKSIKDESLRNEIKDNVIVTGGAITSMLLGELPNDYDVYFRSPEIAKKVVDYYLVPIKEKTNNNKVNEIDSIIQEDGSVQIFIRSAGIVGDEDLNEYDYFEHRDPQALEDYLNKKPGRKPTYSPIMISTNAITLTDKIQIITRFTGEPEEIHKNYDFVHCTNYYSEKTNLVLRLEALEATLAKELKYVGSLFPICSMFRLKKFIRRGWSITAGEMLKIAWDISKLNLNNPTILREQLIGVDAAYFNQILTALNEKGFANLDRTYLFETINRVFDNDTEIDMHAESEDDV